MALLPHEEILCKEIMILASSRMMKMCILPTLMFQLCGVVLVSAQKDGHSKQPTKIQISEKMVDMRRYYTMLVDNQ